jgi:hypothetical protein
METVHATQRLEHTFLDGRIRVLLKEADQIIQMLHGGSGARGQDH